MAKTKRRITRLNKNTLKNRATKKATRRLGRKRQKGGVPSSNRPSGSFTARYDQHARGYNDVARDKAADKLWGKGPSFLSGISKSVKDWLSKKNKPNP